MSDPPPPVIDYRSTDPKSPNNRWWMILLRILIGCIAGGGATIAGVYVGIATNIAILGFLPFIAIFVAALYLSLTLRRRGYGVGVILGPFVTVAAAVAFLLYTCAKHPL